MTLLECSETNGRERRGEETRAKESRRLERWESIDESRGLDRRGGKGNMRSAEVTTETGGREGRREKDGVREDR